MNNPGVNPGLFHIFFTILFAHLPDLALHVSMTAFTSCSVHMRATTIYTGSSQTSAPRNPSGTPISHTVPTSDTAANTVSPPPLSTPVTIVPLYRLTHIIIPYTIRILTAYILPSSVKSNSPVRGRAHSISSSPATRPTANASLVNFFASSLTSSTLSSPSFAPRSISAASPRLNPASTNIFSIV